MCNSYRRWLGLPLALLFLVIAGTAQAQFQGAIYTSNFDESQPNGNHYDDCNDVYVYGGPQNANANGLPPGVYYFQVTTPNGGTLLSTTPASDRLVLVGANGRFAGRCDINGVLLTGSFPHPNGSLNPNNGGLGCQLMPFNETTNNGGEYKVWLIKQYSSDTTVDPDGVTIHFASKDSKTDNFKCKEEVQPPSGFSLGGVKYYDSNMNGQQESGENVLAGFAIKIVLNGDTLNPIYKYTDAFGEWTLDNVLTGTTYDVCEVSPSQDPSLYPNGTSQTWLQTAPAPDNQNMRCYSGTVNGNVTGLDFGNIQQARITGSKFYDTNANGAWDSGEPKITGFKIVISVVLPDNTTGSQTLYTNGTGDFSSNLFPDGTTYTVVEVLPPGNWVQTFPVGGSYSGTLTGTTPTTVAGTIPDATNKNFGNLLIAGGNAKSKGFWGNKNGQTQMNDGNSMVSEFTLLATYTLRNAAGTNMGNFGNNYTTFNNWLQASTAVNMAYMLSAQTVAIVLSIEAGFVSPSALIYAPGTTSANFLGFAPIGGVVAEAKAELLIHPVTTASGAIRTYQEKIKNALDAAANNTNFVSPPVTSVSWPY